MRIHQVLLTVLILAGTAIRSDGGPVMLIGQDRTTNTFFDVFVSLIPQPPPIVPPNPTRDLTDPTHPRFTTDVVNQALFSFGMVARGTGETFALSLMPPPVDLPPPDPLQLVMGFDAVGSRGSIFDVFFDASFIDPFDGTQRAPFSGVLVPNPPPIFPAGSISIEYTIGIDPPMTVGVFVLNPNGAPDLEPMVFSDVPEPSSLAVWGLGLVGFAGMAWRKRKMAA